MAPHHKNIQTRWTKIVATVGPASRSAEQLLHLAQAGVDIFRLNFSHGYQEEKKEIIRDIRAISEQLARPLAILADLQGPKMRVGKFANGVVFLETGREVTLTTRDVAGNAAVIPISYKHLPQDVAAGDRILLDDGSLELSVNKVQDNDILCTIVAGGALRDNKGINLPGVRVSSPSLTAKDRADLEFCMQHEVDFVALSFVRSAADIEEVKHILYQKDRFIHVIAKIERPEGVEHFDAILAVADAIMVARGDLGVEMGPERVPLIQKTIIGKCNQAGKPVITATQMLESMMDAPRPTRAETSDVANAIMDGTDAVMLSGETATGHFPLEAVATMVRVATSVEKIPVCATIFHNNSQPDAVNLPEILANMSCQVAEKLHAAAILPFTLTGAAARQTAKFRPRVPVIAVTTRVDVQRKLNICRGVFSFLVKKADETEIQIENLEQALLNAGVLEKGDLVVITMGSPVSTTGTTNLLKVHRLGTGGFFEAY